MLLFQLLNIAEIEGAVWTRLDACRLISLGAQLDAPVALVRETGCLVDARHAERARILARRASDAFLVIDGHCAVVLVFDDGANGAHILAGRHLAVVAGRCKMVHFYARECSDLVGAHLAQHRAYFEAVLVLARHLTGLASGASRLIVEEADLVHSHPPLVQRDDALRQRAVGGQRLALVALEIAVVVVVSRRSHAACHRSAQNVVCTRAIDPPLRRSRARRHAADQRNQA